MDLSKPQDLSLPLSENGPRAWYVGPMLIEPVRSRDEAGVEKIYAVKDGAPVNFRNVSFNPHGHGTHTESVGHISPETHPVGNLLKRYFFFAQVVSVRPETRRAPGRREDRVIALEQLRHSVNERPPENAGAAHAAQRRSGWRASMERHQPLLPAKHRVRLAAQHRREAPVAGPSQRGPRRGWRCAGCAPRLLGFPGHHRPGAHDRRDDACAE
ncbi:MAG: cyclase family protein [Flavobacteriales bacterium]|nr:cyclase family protein [Flavobacteriales bacterium]